MIVRNLVASSPGAPQGLLPLVSPQSFGSKAVFVVLNFTCPQLLPALTLLRWRAAPRTTQCRGIPFSIIDAVYPNVPNLY